LWAARYNRYIDGPWEDGRFKFRDWERWHLWQYTDKLELPGSPDENDGNYFNGDENDLRAWLGAAPAPQTWEQAMTEWARSLGYDGPEPG
jgi:GH25 family lysozyme M1 (1,4-beta-N-acetylmuramidase)